MDDKEIQETWERVKEDYYNSIFTLESMFDMWPRVMMIRDQFGFSDKISDNEMIKENKWAIEQYRKFVSTKEGSFKKVWDNYADVVITFENAYSSLKEDFDERKEAIYQTLRDSWILASINLLSNMSPMYGGE